MDLPKEVKSPVNKHKFLEVITNEANKTRVKCKVTTHELLPTKAAIEQHLNSKKFKKANEWYSYDFSKYEPFIVPHNRKEKSLYCNVTKKVLNRIPSEVERHVNGKSYKRLRDQMNVSMDDDKSQQEGEFDADKFEFMNGQLLISDDEGDEDGNLKEDASDEEEQSEMEDVEETETKVQVVVDGKKKKTEKKSKKVGSRDEMKEDVSVRSEEKENGKTDVSGFETVPVEAPKASVDRNPFSEDDDEEEHFVDAPEPESVNKKQDKKREADIPVAGPSGTGSKKRKNKRRKKN